MKHLWIVCLLLIASCANNKSDETKTENTVSNQTPSTDKTNAPPGDGITGSWKMSLDAFDHNENQVLDDEERKKAVPNNYRLQLNADGTCKIQGVYNGTYKVKEEGGKKILEIQRKKIEGEETEDPIPDIYHIKSLTQDEMVLLTTEAGSTVTFWIFKREN